MKYIYIILLASLLISCKKDWLDAKPSTALVIPTKVEDFQALLDNSAMMNENQAGSSGEVSAGDFQLSYASYLNCAAAERNAYIWSATDDFYEGEGNPEWRNSYQRVLSANLVLEGIEAIEKTPLNTESWNNVKGSALFYRAYDFYSLAQEYCKPYSNTANTDPGIPLRVSSDVNQPSKRATVKETYDKIITDLNEAKTLLPISPIFTTRPSKPAVFALLARIYLSMGDYSNALENADACLKLYNKLIDYSDLIATATNPIVRFNDEVIYQCRLGNAVPFLASNFNATPELLALYNPNDLRLKIFFRASGVNTVFKGSYDGSSVFFSGLAVDEMLMTRSECNARAGNVTAALKDLNDLLAKRWVKNPAYVNFTTQDKDVAILKILEERRKELCFRGLRWTDLRRLNQEGKYSVSLSRTLNGQNYVLPPNDLKYVFPLDDDEIRLSGIEQNPRH